jgi:LysM repeat protein
METAQPIDNQYTQPKEKSRYQKRTRSRKISPATFWVSLAAILVILPLLFVSTVIIYFQVNQLNLPGVFIYDEPVGLASYQQTSTKINAEWNLNRRINLICKSDPSISYWFSPAELGLWVDPQGTADAAYAVGRGSEPFKEINAALEGEPHVVYPVLYFDEAIAKETLSKIEAELAVQSKDAQVAFQDGKWIAVPGSEGREVDIDRTISELYENAFNILLTGTASLAVSYPSPTITDLTPVLNEIEQVISQEMKLSAYDPIEDESFYWSVPTEVKQNWISVNKNDYSVSMTFNEDDIASLIEAWEDELGQGRSFKNDQPETIVEGWREGKTTQLILQHDPTTYEVKPGETLWSISLKLGMPMYHIMEANEGLSTNNVSAGMILDIPSKNILLPLPVVSNKRIVVDISEQRMTVYENGEVRNTYIVSTGVSNSPTMPGIFQVQSHEINAYASNWDLYMPHFMGIYEAWPGFMNGIHGLPLLSSGQRLWASTLGSPASYGCIILDLAAAEDLYYWADPGVVVEIVR